MVSLEIYNVVIKYCKMNDLYSVFYLIGSNDYVVLNLKSIL